MCVWNEHACVGRGVCWEGVCVYGMSMCVLGGECVCVGRGVCMCVGCVSVWRGVMGCHWRVLAGGGT